MKTIKDAPSHSLNLVAYGLFVSLLLTTHLLTPAPIVYAEALMVTASATSQPTIIGGQPAEIGEWPWQAVVMAGTNFCGGTLIHTEWLLTAAHCIYDTENHLYPADAVQVTLGDYHLYTAEEHEQQFTVDRVLVHPSLNLAAYDNDIALLHLSTPATITPYVAPIALQNSPEHDGLVTPGTLATVSGWGSTKENAGLSPLLREVEVPIIDNTDCLQSYSGLTENMLCAGYAEGKKDACQGDSGGPLMVPDQTGNWKLAGLVSFGRGCGRALYYGVYTRIANYVDWIEETTGPLAPPAGVTTIEETATPTMVPTATATASATATATASPTPLPSDLGEPPASPTPSEVYGYPAQNFLPVVYR